MKHELPQLPYAMTALAPHLSEETLSFHYGKHHATYVDKLNGLIPGTEFENKSLEEIVKSAKPGGVFNNAAQIWNHSFYWHSMSPERSQPAGALLEAVNKAFGSVEELKKKFTEAAVGHFGSGWAWLVKKADGSLAVESTHDAACPITEAGTVPLLTCDVWEHAYYIDFRNARPKYLEAWWELANWNFAQQNFAKG